MFRADLLSAIKDYRWLLDRHYPQRSTIHLVGDRYKLSGQERSILYRGVSDSFSAKERFEKITLKLDSHLIAIDCYNVLITLTNYLMGKPVYISDDGIIRDSGESRGRIYNKEIFNKSIILLEEFMEDNRDKMFFLLLDSPVSNSGKLAIKLAEFLNSSGIRGIAETLNSPDYVLQRLNNALICTSDSVIINRTNCSVFDLSRVILERSFKTRFDSILSLF